MKLKALDQILVSSVQPDILMPGQEFEVNDAYGADLVKRNPRSFAVIDKTSTPNAETAEKAIIGAPKNKAQDAAPSNKAEGKPKSKAD